MVTIWEGLMAAGAAVAVIAGLLTGRARIVALALAAVVFAAACCNAAGVLG